MKCCAFNALTHQLNTCQQASHGLYSQQRFQQAILTCKVGHTDLVLVCNEGSLVRLCKQDYKSLCAVVTICATLADPKFNLYIMTCDLEKQVKPEVNLSVGADAPMMQIC